VKKSLLLFFFGILLVIGFFWIYFPTLTRYRDLKLEDDKLGKDLTGLEFKIEDLREEKDLLVSDREYIEKVIREELGLVKPGETVYKFVEDEPLKLEELLPVEEPPKSEEKKTEETKPTAPAAALQVQPQVEPDTASNAVLEPEPHYETLPEFRVVEEVDEEPVLKVSKPKSVIQKPAPLVIPRTEQPRRLGLPFRPFPRPSSLFKKSPSGTEKFVPRATAVEITSIAHTALRPRTTTQGSQPKLKYKPKLLRQFPPPEPDEEESSEEDESLFERLKNEVTTLFSGDEDEPSYEEASSLQPLPRRKLNAGAPLPKASSAKIVSIPALPRRISQPLPVAQPQKQIPSLASHSVYPRQETR